VTVGALVDLAVTLTLGVLFGVIGFLLKGKVENWDATVGELQTEVRTMGREMVRLTEAQKAVVASQSTLSQVHVRLLDDTDDLADQTQQLELANQRVRDRLAAHDEYLRILRGDTAGDSPTHSRADV